MGFRAGLIGAVVIAASAPGLAQAAEARAFNVRPQPLAQALIDFALQADISISAQAASACGPSRGLSGRFTVEAGLRRLLAGTGCEFRMIDARSAVIARTPPRRPPAPRPAPAPAPAKPAPLTHEAVEVEELIVTSPKRTVGLSRAPYAVSAVDGERLVEAGAADAAGVAARVAGMTVTNLGAGRNKVFLRGLADGALTGRTQSVVGIYLDDARVIYNAPDPDLRLTDVERVEVLRGPQGSLYGAGSIGGIVQIVTTRPDLDRWEGSLTAGGQITEGGAGGDLIEGVVNAPLIAGRLAARIVGYREASGGVIDDPGLGLADVDRTVRQGLRTTVALRLNPAWQARATYLDQTIHAEDTHYSETETGDYARALALREPFRNDFDGLTTVIEGDLGWGRLKLSNAVQRHEIDARHDAGLSLALFDPGAAGPARFDEASAIDALVTEASLASRADRRLTWIAGVFASEYTQNQTGVLTAAAPGELYREARRDHIDEYAAYGEASWSFSERLRVTAGGRYYRLAVETRATIVEPAAAQTSAFEGETSDQGFAPKLLVEYDWSDQVLLYAQAAEGYRAGGFNTAGQIGQAFNAPGGGPQPFRRFQGDELVSYEAGARLSLLDGALKIRLAAFRAEWSRIQTDRLLADGLPFTANVGDGHNTGLEVEAAWRRGGLTLEGDLLINDPELSDPDPGFPIPADRHLPGIADVLANASARYEWTSGRGVQAWVGLDVGYVGRSSLTFDAALAPEMGGYVTSRAQAGLAGEAWRASVYVDNLFGQDGDTFAYGNPFRLRSRDAQTPQRPTTVGLVLTRRF